ncbi:MAG: hypothetical protein AAFP76_13630 [Bacteroidota bacterium]
MKKYLFLLAMVGLMLTSCATRVVTTTPATTKVVYIKQAPRNHTVVRINGKRYYKWNGKHYRKTRRGFVFVRV